MPQQIIALIVVIYFVFRLFAQKQKNLIGANEFALWLVFWFFAGLAAVFIRKIDSFVASMGFSGSGIEVLLYLGVVLLFYFIFKIRLRLEKIEKDITKIVRNIALGKEKGEK